MPCIHQQDVAPWCMGNEWGRDCAGTWRTCTLEISRLLNCAQHVKDGQISENRLAIQKNTNIYLINARTQNYMFKMLSMIFREITYTKEAHFICFMSLFCLPENAFALFIFNLWQRVTVSLGSLSTLSVYLPSKSGAAPRLRQSVRRTEQQVLVIDRNVLFTK